jgi:N-acetylneuraminate synthase/N,N'-diacetyllegionaminate synthase
LRDIRIGERSLAYGLPYLVAEAGVNHDGDLTTALEMVDLAADVGVDAVKFQMFGSDDLVRIDAPSAAYQGRAKSQHQLLTDLQLDQTDLAKLAEHARHRGIEFLCTPFSVGALRFLVDELDVVAIKLSSGDLTYSELLRVAAATGLPILLSTGMATMDEIQRALDDLRAGTVVLLQCVSQYPAPTGEANLRTLATLQELTGAPVGFSDHSSDTAPSIAAVALGARLIERHFTLDRNRPGPDHRASLDPADLRRWVADVAAAHAALGDGVKSPQPSEIETRFVARRSLVAGRDLLVGETVMAADLLALRPADGISPQEVDRVVGRTMRRAVDRGRPLRWDDLT